MIEWIDRMVEEDGLQLCPDFQRGHVWTEQQTPRGVRSFWEAGSGRTIYLNNPNWMGKGHQSGYTDFVCVDGP